MRITQAVVRDEYEWTRERAPTVVALINQVRADLGEIFDTDPAEITGDQYRAGVDEVFADGDLAVNVATMVHVLRDLDVEADYPGFVVDEVLGRELAAMLAGQQPLRLLGEATFHFADVHTHGDSGDPAGADDLDAALAAGFQTRLPGWAWRNRESPFDVVHGDRSGGDGA